ncbi:YciI family protein [Phenylobacterium deserti]|uniref:YCII-related domain-containing protein n=1 Tax=Phenylobacterium deserti TaxID=1914756 RepID=A0A328ARF8_9CAUL|nr:YciI family protein [Phenylobacterium deserti]RAK56831.1 hypothetical protein DJ018_02330 [Phenylobacterium deserti]
MKYLVVAIRRPDFRAEVGAAHQAFLSELRGQGKIEQSGGFTDKTGGAYVVLADDLETAKAMVARDPLVLEGVSDLTVYEWDAK